MGDIESKREKISEKIKSYKVEKFEFYSRNCEMNTKSAKCKL